MSLNIEYYNSFFINLLLYKILLFIIEAIYHNSILLLFSVEMNKKYKIIYNKDIKFI